MGKGIITFGNIDVEKYKFHLRKSPISIHNVDISKIVESTKFPFGKKGFKYFVGYKDAKTFRLLCVMLPK